MDVKLYTIENVAAMLGVNHMTVRRWIREGQITAIRLPGGSIRISHDEVVRILSTQVAKAGRN